MYIYIYVYIYIYIYIYILCRSCSNAEIFNASKVEYKIALKNIIWKKRIVTEKTEKEISYGLTHHLAKQILQNNSWTN